MGFRDLNTTQMIALFIGVVTAMGFSLGAIFSYSGMVSTNSAQDKKTNLSVPEQSYQEQPFDLSTREQRSLGIENDIVFVNGFYSNRSQKEDLEKLQDLVKKFDNRVYVSVGNSSAGSDIIQSFGLADFPRVVVIGGNQNHGGAPLQDVSSGTVSQEICKAFRDLGEQAGQCI